MMMVGLMILAVAGVGYGLLWWLVRRATDNRTLRRIVLEASYGTNQSLPIWRAVACALSTHSGVVASRASAIRS